MSITVINMDPQRW